MLLKIARDFNYNEDQGEYTPKSDVILGGGCQSQCGASDWHKVDTGVFSIFAPLAWEFHQLPGVDSYVGEFVGDGVVLNFDFGRYSSSFKEAREPAYVIAHESICGLPAKVVSPRTPGHGLTGIYFRKARDQNALCVWGQDLTSAQQELALKIFETIRFEGGQVPNVIPPPGKGTQ